MKLYQPSTIKELRDKYGFNFTKSLGQNFLTDKNIIDKIIEGSLIGPDDLAIEIGPGIGVLTREIAEVSGRVAAVEIDNHLIPILNDTLSDLDNVKIINRDILKTDITELIREESKGISGKVRVIGNLPYYITTPIIMKLLEEGSGIDTITVMMQKEVADRIMASPGKKDCGAISLMVQYFADITEIARVPRSAFIPQPKVDSTVLRLDVREEPPCYVRDRYFMFDVIKAGFGQRRKTIANSLGTLKGYTKEEIRTALGISGIDPVRRGETLSLNEYSRICDALLDMKH